MCAGATLPDNTRDRGHNRSEFKYPVPESLKILTFT